MAIYVIDTIKPKNNGEFPVVESEDVKVSSTKRLNTALSEITYTVTPEMFGAKGDGETDDSEAIQSCFDYADSQKGLFKHGKVTFNSEKTYIVNSTVYIPMDMSIDFNCCTLKCTNTSNLNNGFMFYYNIDSNGSVLSPYPKCNIVIENALVEGIENSPASVNFIYIAQSAEIRNISFYYVNKCIYTADTYIDLFHVHHCGFARRTGTDYAIKSGYLGDNRKYDHLGCSGDNINMLSIGSGHLQVNVANIVNATIESYAPTSFRNVMLSKTGKINVYGGDCVFELIYLTKDNNAESRITIDSYEYSLYSETKPAVVMRDVRCMYIDAATSFGNAINIKKAKSIELSNVITGIFQNTLNNGICAYEKITFGESKYEKYNTYTWYYDGKLINEFDNSEPVCELPDSDIGLGDVTTTGVPFNGTPKEYYYRLQPIIDINRRCYRYGSLERHNTAESSRSLQFNNSDIAKVKNCTLRLYRGEASGIYNKYVDIVPVGTRFIDTGNMINGVAWKDFESAIPDEPLNISTYAKDRKGNIHITFEGESFGYASGWQVGDTVDVYTGEDVISQVYTSNGWRQTNSTTE